MAGRRRSVADLLRRSAVVILGAVAVAAACGQAPPPPRQPPADDVRVLSFNLWHGGDGGGQPLAQSAAVIRASGADIVGLQETHGRERDGQRPDHGARLAAQLGWHYLAQAGRTGILSRWPLTPIGDGPLGATIALPSGRPLALFNVHLAHAPYQPYQLLGIPYEDAPFLTTAAEAVAAADAARAAQLDPVLDDVRLRVAAGEAIVLMGDFNEPSHLDWTPRAHEAGLVPLAVPYPSSQRVHAAGLRDAFRAVHPDETTRPGWTWTPTTRPDDPADRHDRIDFVYVSGADVRDAAVVGERADAADVVVTPWPSDHRAVLVRLAVGGTP